jgi:hypothetical protein
MAMVGLGTGVALGIIAGTKPKSGRALDPPPSML